MTRSYIFLLLMRLKLCPCNEDCKIFAMMDFDRSTKQILARKSFMRIEK